jgi:phosphoribosylanthranilate isomerase
MSAPPLFRIKICGMTTADDARAAAHAGADAVGFIFYPKSPRCITPAAAAAIGEKLPDHVARVAVQVGWTLETVAELERIMRIDVWQLHGAETPATTRALRPRTLVKVFGLPRNDEVDPSDYDVDGFLLDKASPLHGGTGETFAWPLATAFQKTTPRPCILSGGLTPDNVEHAVKTVQPWGVDVCSGVESSPGRKDHVRMTRFIHLCRPLLT